MGKHMKLLSILLILSLAAGCLPAKTGKAADDDYNLVCTTASGTYYLKTADEAFDALEKAGGGVIRMCRTVDFAPTKLRYLSENMKIVVPESILMTIGGAGIQGPGSFEVYGTLDLTNSTCTTFHITGGITTMNRGEIVTTLANIGSLDKISDIAVVLNYGQRLPSDNIDDQLVGTRVYKGGSWHYVDQTTIFEAGTHTVDVYYDYSRTVFRPMVVKREVDIRVDKTTPALSQYEAPEIELGQTLKSVHPKYSFINPYTNEQVAGTLTYTDLDSTFNALGTKQVKASFVPKDSANYSTAELTLEVTVVSASPTVVSKPYAGQGQYGQTLGDITLSQGSCVDASTGDTVAGTWSWKNEKETLVSGEHSYLAVFTPKDTTNYKKIEVSVSVQTAKKKMTSVEWPTVSPLNEGQYLFEAELSFTSNEYGNFVWEDETKLPSVEYKGAVLVFVPYDKENYDWSYTAGYDAATQNVKKTMALQIIPAATDTPVPTPTTVPTTIPTTAPTTVPTTVPTIAPTTAPTNVPTTAPAVTPTNSPVATDTPVPTLTTAPTNSPAATTPATVTETAVPTNSPTATTPATVTETAVPTNSPTVVAGATESPQTSTESQDSTGSTENDDPVVIKKMVSTISTIKTPKSGKAFTNRSKIKSIQHSGRKIKVQIKKVKNAKYEVRVATRKDMKKPRKKTSSKPVIVFKHLKKGQYYYIQSRVWKQKQGKHKYSKWSKKRKVKL